MVDRIEHCTEEGHVAFVYGMNKIVVDRKQGCFRGMKRSVSGLVGRQEVECRTVGSEAPTDDTFNELGYVRQVRNRSIRTGNVWIHVRFL